MLYRQTLLYLPAQVVGPIAQLVSALIWTHFLSPEEMGIFALIVASQELVYLATLFWFSLYTLRYAGSGTDGSAHAEFLETEAYVLAGSSVAAALAVLALPLWIDGAWTADLLLATAAYVVTRGLATHLADRARAQHDTLTYSILQISWPVIGLVLGIALVPLFAHGTVAVLTGYALAQAGAVAVGIARLGIGSHGGRFSREKLRTAIAYGVPLVIGAMLIWVAANGVRFIVNASEGAAAVGLITVGWSLGLRSAGFAAMLVTAAGFPLAVRRAREEGMAQGQQQLVSNGVLLLVALAPAAAGLWAISDPLVHLFVAVPFHEITLLVLPFAIIAGTIRNFRVHFGEQVFLLHEKTVVPLVNDALDAAATLIAGMIGMHVAGLEGLLIGVTLAAALSLAVTLMWAWRAYGFAFPMSHLVRIGGATLLMTLLVEGLTAGPSASALVLSLALGAASYALAIGAFYPVAAERAIGALRGMALRFKRGEAI